MKQPNWTPAELATLVDLFNQRRSIQTIAAQMGRSYKSISIKESQLRERGAIGYRTVGQCTVEDCRDPHFGRGLCGKHYQRMRRREVQR